MEDPLRVLAFYPESEGDLFGVLKKMDPYPMCSMVPWYLVASV